MQVDPGTVGDVGHLGRAMTLSIGAGLSARLGANPTRTMPATRLRRGLAMVLCLTIGILVYRPVA